MAECDDDFSTKLSLQKFLSLLDKLTPDQKKDVEQMGFGFLLGLSCTELPRALVKWLVQYFMPSTRFFELPSGFKFMLNSYIVHCVLGIPLGGRVIPRVCGDEFRKHVKSQTHCAGHTPTIRELMDLIVPELDEVDFKRLFMMFAIATLLSPTSYECVSPDLFGALEGPVSDICLYDWSGAVADKLALCIERFNEKGCTGALGGCLLVPVVSFISLVLFFFFASSDV